MAAKHGRNTSLKLDNAAGTLTDLSTAITSLDFPREAELLDATHFQSADKEFVPGFRDGKISFEGFADATVSTHLNGILGQEATVSFEYGPEGTATGKRKFTGEAILVKYNEKGAVNELNKFSAELQISGAVTLGTFA